MNGKRSITTGGGDKGMTSLCSGERVSKDSPRCAACGDLDELTGILGVARSQSVHAEVKEALLMLQRDLFVVGAEVASTNKHLDRLEKRVDADMLDELESRQHRVEVRVVMPKKFIIPGDVISSAHLDLARAVARRCERDIVALVRSGEIHNEYLVVWMNRVSDYLWLLARIEEQARTADEE